MSRFSMASAWIVLTCAFGVCPLPGLFAQDEGKPPLTAGSPLDAVNAQQALLKSLPDVAEIQKDGAQVVWKGDGSSATIVGIDLPSQDPLILTASGALRVERRLIDEHRTKVLAKVAALLEQAHRAKIAITGVRLEEDSIIGASLRGEGVVLLPQGTLRSKPLSLSDRSADLTRISQDIDMVVKSLPSTGLDEIGRRSLEAMLRELDHKDGNQLAEALKPGFMRHLVRHGWLRQWFTAPEGAKHAQELEDAVTAATTFRPILLQQGAGMRLEQVQDAYQAGAWIFTTSDKVRFVRTETRPEYLPVRGLEVAIDLPAGGDPAKQAGLATAAQIYSGLNPVASWSAQKGFECDEAGWNRLFHVNISQLIPRPIPPHILLCDLNGDVAGLAVRAGVLQPAQDATRPAAETFLDNAARLLVQPNQLDLIGEYLFTYVLPSPEASHPQLLGNPQLCDGSIQQTVWQTCGNVTGGIMHGDCADLAELYEKVLIRQKASPIVVGLPEHAACAWAVKSQDAWTVTVLQTGPPMQFNDQKLPVCLEKAYKSFDPDMVFDADQLPLLLRFSGEQSRSQYALSWRIFSDPAYAKTMFDVQRDWQYQTYQHAITAMSKLIADGDQDVANYCELSGLFRSTGQFVKAIDEQVQVIAHTPDARKRLPAQFDLLNYLLNAGKIVEAKTLALDLLDHQLPALKDSLGPTYPNFGFRLALACTSPLKPEGAGQLQPIAVRALEDIGGVEMDKNIEQLGAWLHSRNFNQDMWDRSTQLVGLRGRIGAHCLLELELMKGMSPKAIASDERLRALAHSVQQWFTSVAFYDVQVASAVMIQYARVGRWYTLLHGRTEFNSLVAHAPLPTGRIDHTARIEGDAQMTRDLSWIRASPFYWFDCIAECFSRDHQTLDTAAVATFAASLEQARATTAALGFTTQNSEEMVILGEELAALAAQDEARLRKVLHRISISNDKFLRDSATEWIGNSAPLFDLAWYQRILKAWSEEVDYKPKYLLIAWVAAVNHLPKQALLAAKLAAERFKDDPVFADEYRGLLKLLAPQ